MCVIFNHQKRTHVPIIWRDIINKNILKQAAMLHPEEIMQPFDEIMGLHGFDVVYTLAEHFSGCTIYVPNVRTIFSRCIEEEARKEFRGGSIAMLSRKYGYTERHLRRMFGHP